MSNRRDMVIFTLNSIRKEHGYLYIILKISNAKIGFFKENLPEVIS